MTDPEYDQPEFDQIVKGNVTIKKISKHKYRITFRKIGKFLIYQVWDKDNQNLNNKRQVSYVSAKTWVNNFIEVNKLLKNSQLFTPTTVMETEDDDKKVFVIHKAYLNKYGHVVFAISTKEINTSSTKIIKIPCGKFNNVRFDIDAPPRNWQNILFNVSDCGYPNFRRYSFGGAEGITGEACGTFDMDGMRQNLIWSDPNKNWTLCEVINKFCF